MAFSRFIILSLVYLALFKIQRTWAEVGILSSKGYLCQTACEKTSSNGYYWCKLYAKNPDNLLGFMITGQRTWDYCSPSPDVDYYDRECINSCDYYGYSYSWCRVQNSWGYCSHQDPHLEPNSFDDGELKSLEGELCRFPCEYIGFDGSHCGYHPREWYEGPYAEEKPMYCSKYKGYNSRGKKM